MIRLLVMCFAFAPCAHAASVRVSWQPNPDTDIAGYRMEYVSPPLAPVTIDTDELSVSVDGLAAGATYSFRLKAVNSSGMFSGWSESVSYTVPVESLPPAAPAAPPAGVIELPPGSAIVIGYEWSADLETWNPMADLSVPAPLTLPGGSVLPKLFLRARVRSPQTTTEP